MTGSIASHSIVVVGASGFIGTHALPRLVDCGAGLGDVRDRTACRPRRRGFDSRRFPPCDPTTTWPTARRCGVPGAEPGLAGISGRGGRTRLLVNVRGPACSRRSSTRAGLERDDSIFASSGSVYGEGLDVAHESEPFDLSEPKTAYVASKLAAEVLLRPYASLMHVIVLRLFAPHGHGQPAEMLIPRLVRRVSARTCRSRSRSPTA